MVKKQTTDCRRQTTANSSANCRLLSAVPFAEFITLLLADTTLVAAVDGKAAQPMNDADGNPILMLNVFAQHLKLHLASWNVRGEKTSEPNCLKKHLEDLFTMYPSLKLLTGDAIFAQRPLLEALQEYGAGLSVSSEGESTENVKEDERSLQGCGVTRAGRHDRDRRRDTAKKEEPKVARPQGH
jgi:hypothetical protein